MLSGACGTDGKPVGWRPGYYGIGPDTAGYIVVIAGESGCIITGLPIDLKVAWIAVGGFIDMELYIGIENG